MGLVSTHIDPPQIMSMSTQRQRPETVNCLSPLHQVLIFMMSRQVLKRGYWHALGPLQYFWHSIFHQSETPLYHQRTPICLWPHHIGGNHIQQPEKWFSRRIDCAWYLSIHTYTFVVLHVFLWVRWIQSFVVPPTKTLCATRTAFYWRSVWIFNLDTALRATCDSARYLIGMTAVYISTRSITRPWLAMGLLLGNIDSSTIGIIIRLRIN